jgi:hypothetical protein
VMQLEHQTHSSEKVVSREQEGECVPVYVEAYEELLREHK